MRSSTFLVFTFTLLINSILVYCAPLPSVNLVRAGLDNLLERDMSNYAAKRTETPTPAFWGTTEEPPTRRDAGDDVSSGDDGPIALSDDPHEFVSAFWKEDELPEDPVYTEDEALQPRLLGVE
ncbi:hypothetical protein CONPUDRAFT_161985 [Coniophora puteana RWD-64-598 SS2]|uniref:Uncharacterized protein n=1 Tax=Coniophora puteana (strain RWD-64-598) TaxID=741705 RepID=A0A5M3N7P0_CONPW|nr:uncharacterized protein CONPUDRAFT_161985 [Coniophora puteana RWD-64-598 SS2]EIW87459.1 hypothetical protein CONPUDRAFT_161985 [Coniophora puteana RWD-64-598 SS2]